MKVKRSLILLHLFLFYKHSKDLSLLYLSYYESFMMDIGLLKFQVAPFWTEKFREAAVCSSLLVVGTLLNVSN